MAWIEHEKPLPSEPYLILSKVKREKDLENAITYFREWPKIFGFELCQKQYSMSTRTSCRADILAEADKWRCGYIIELTLNQPHTKKHNQVRRYLRLVQSSHRWARKVCWHGLIIYYVKGYLFPYRVR